ncbi:hypothetical protein DEU29_10354 [Idiomarina aquatica]|uniref:Uncharacterized protein n=1 Tax=Idiomarina aquatica TaxID=1327752 RepID=A0A4R6PMQ7_9GAMM|nr:hypothetical protein [Idiomarina aquatica]TDP39159.1 hypothetical protein DEU29_10354 [Idiomarina aquatica]
MSTPLRVSSTIPHLFAFSFCIIFAVHGYVSLEATSALDRPSSTFALGYLFLPIYAAIQLGIGYLLGFIFRFLLRRFRFDLTFSHIKQLVIAFGITIILSGFSGYSAYQQVVENVALKTPRIISNAGRFERRNSIPVGAKKVAASSILTYDANTSGITWHGAPIVADVKDNTLILKSGEKPRLSYDFSGYTYVSSINILTVQQSSQQWLALLVKLRPTSGISMLLVYDALGQLRYEELLSHCQPKQSLTLYEAAGNNLLVANSCEDPIVLKLTSNG